MILRLACAQCTTATCCTVVRGEKKKLLSLSYTDVHTSVMISSPRGRSSHQHTRLKLPISSTIRGEKWNILFIFCGCICKSKLDQRVKKRQSGGRVQEFLMLGITSNKHICSTLGYEHKQCRCSNSLLVATHWSLIMSVITKTRCSARNPSSNLISKLSIQSQAL